MNFKTKSAALDRIYNLYEEFVSTLDIACKKGCVACCTSHVTLTTLEGYRIAAYLKDNNCVQQLRLLDPTEVSRRFRPHMTFNTLAEWCARQQDPPDETPDSRRGVCPMLVDNGCAVYPVRPFGCRCLISKNICEKQGFADIDDFVLTVNTVFLQIIEHLDTSGATGNLYDILRFFESKAARRDYRDNRLNLADSDLISNHALTYLMIPPEHQRRIKPILDLLNKI